MAGHVQRVVGGWFGGISGVRDETFLEALEAHALSNPSCPALRIGAETVSYGVLVERIHDVASRLDVSPGDVIAVRMADSVRSFVLLLGALRAGAVCLALDPRLPPSRESDMLAQAGAVDILDERVQLGARLGSTPPMPGGDQSAYVVFTSGTTGRPKGVLVTHRGLHLTAEHSAYWFGLESGDRLLCTASWAFDASWWETAVALTSGATIVRSPLELAATYLAEVDAALMTPSVANWLAPHVRGLRCFGLAGEAPNTHLVQQLTDRASKVLNLYGPAEASICVSIGEITPGQTIHAGAPLPGVYAYVLDAGLEPVPDGERGQLHISGRCVGNGYIGDEAELAKKFVPDPFRPGETMYVTGDIASFDSEGRITLHGRIDDQLKIRGVRVEPAEVAEVIRGLDGVLDVAVCPVVMGGREVLGALIVGDDFSEQGQLLAAVQQGCRERLPDAMIPRVWNWADALPIGVGGKLNRSVVVDALSSNLEGDLDDDSDFDDNVSSFQRAVRQSLAGTPDLALSLLEQGLDSLGAVRLAAEVNRELGIDLRAADMMANRSLRELEDFVGRADAQSHETPRTTEYDVLSPGEARLYHLWHADRSSTSYNVPFTVDFVGEVDCDRLVESVRYTVRAHDELHARFVEDPDLHVEIVPTELSIDVLDLEAERDRERCAEEALADIAWVPFDLSEGRLIRAVALRLGRRSVRLILVAHHAVIDGASATSIAEQIFATYAYGPAQLSGSGDGYRRYATGASLRAARQGERLREGWTDYLRGAPDVLGMPFTTNPIERGSAVSINVAQQLAPELARALRETAQQTGCTLFHVLLAAYGHLLSTWAGTQDTVVAALTSHRPTVEDGDTVGFFIETLPVRVPRMRAKSDEAIRAVRDSVVHAMSLADLPFEDIVSQVSATRVPGRMPLAQMAINMFDLPAPWVAHDGQVSASLAFPLARDSKFDILLYIHPGQQGMELRWAFRADMFSHELIEQFTRQFRDTLTAISGLTVQSPSAVDTETRCEQRIDLVSRPARGKVLRADGTEHDVRHTVVSLLGHLTSQGIERRGLIAIRAERTPVLAAALVALREESRPWLILDPSWPEPLVEEILARVKPAALVSLTPQLAVTALDGWSALPDDVGYVASTSGTTGIPKLVFGDGEAIDSQVQWHLDKLRGDRVRGVMSSGLAYDPLLRDIFVPLLADGVLLVPDVEPHQAPAVFLDQLELHEITLLHSTPGVLGTLTDVDHKPIETMRLVLLGGENLTHANARAAHRLFPNARIFNVYGTTESPQIASAFEWTPEVGSDQLIVPIGSGRGANRVLVVDERGELCPVGVLGEVAIESPQLARGYLGSDGQPTALRSGGRPGRYLTGDLGRIDLAGRVHLAGRGDHQVKVAGVRVELDGIEATVRAVEGVQRVTVRPGGINSNGGALVAIVQPEATADTSRVSARVEAALAARLGPNVMPHIVVTRSPVLTASGKVDVPATLQIGDGGDYELPWSATEREVADLWSEVLGSPPERPTVSFFHIGGNSLSALRMLRRLDELTGVAITASDFFSAPTVRSLATLIEEEEMRVLTGYDLQNLLES